MNSSLLEKSTFLRPEKKRADLNWEHPFLLKEIFKNCEIQYQGHIRQPEKLFSQHELTHINLIYAGTLFRLQKIMQQNIPCQLTLFKDEQQIFTELCVEFALGLDPKELHEFILQELEAMNKKYPHFSGKPHFRWRHNPASDRKQLSFELRIKS